MSKNEPRITVDGKTAPCPECHISGDHKMSCSRGGSKGARFTMRMEHAADAVTMLQRMHACVVLSENHGDVPRIGSDEVLAVLRATQAERARHAEEVARLRDVHLDETRALDDLRLKEIASLRDQLRRAEGERDAERKHATEMEERALDLVRDLRLAQTELHALRSLLPDVRALARFTYRAAAEGQLVPEFSSAQKLLAADFLREPCPECHMVERCKRSCSRGGSKGGRFSVSLDSQGGEGE